jgi:hypothetical protein
MAPPQAVDPVKFFVAILWTDADSLDDVLPLLEQHWGDVDFMGGDRPFDATEYYEAEMGANLKRRLVSFGRLFPPEEIRQAKLDCNQIEDQLAVAGRRRVNLDIGYLDRGKVVLASAKFAGQKIHLGDGIYADMISRYGHGRYQPFEWTFPDFRDGRYDEDLAQIRRTYLAQLRARNEWRSI